MFVNIEAVRFRFGDRFVWSFIISTAVLLVVMTGIIFIPRARIKIQVYGEPVVTTVSSIVDANIDSISPGINKMPGRLVSTLDQKLIYALSEKGWIYDHHLVATTAQGKIVLMYRDLDMQKLVENKLAGLVVDDRKLRTEKNILVNIVEAKHSSDSTTIEIRVIAEGLTIPILPVESWGPTTTKSPTVLGEKISKIKGVSGFLIDIWPDFWPYLPMISSNIRYDLDIL